MWSLSSGLAASIRGSTTDAFFPVAALGVLLGFLLAARRVRAMWAWTIMLLLGLIFTVIHIGNLSRSFFNVVQAGSEYQMAGLKQWPALTPPDSSELRTASRQLISGTTKVIRRVVDWANNYYRGRVKEDSLVRKILWSVSALLAAAWAGWGIQRHRQALPALAPATALLAYVLDYSGADSLILQFHLFLLLMLVSLTEGSAALNKLTEGHPRLGANQSALQATIAAAFLLVLIAGYIPSASSYNSLDEDKRVLQRNNAVAQALGLQVVTAQEGSVLYYSPTLPREHLVGSTPGASPNVVFYVSTGDLPPMERVIRAEAPPRYYWRAVTYDVYTGRGWATTISKTVDVSPNQSWLETIPSGFRMLHLEVKKAVPYSGMVWTGTLLESDQPFEAAWRFPPDSLPQRDEPLRGADLAAALTESGSYQADALLPTASIEELRASTIQYPERIRLQYLALPSTVPERVLALAEELTSDAPNPFDRARAIETYLHRFPYSLDVPIPPADRDVTDYFLFDLQRGYCDYYATAMVVLARAAGLPARLVIGYASGEYDPREAHYIVRERDAHSWVEIYFTDIGWVEFEPTANRPPIEREAQSVVTAPGEQTDLTETKPVSEPGLFGVIEKIPQVFLFSLLAISGTAIAAWRLINMSNRQRRPREAISRLYQEVYRLGRAFSSDSSPAETPSQFAERLGSRLSEMAHQSRFGNLLAPARGELASLTDVYLRSLYSPRLPTRAELKSVFKLWRRFSLRLHLARLLYRIKVRPGSLSPMD
jgi:transglutaminase-like putative cysteine protease